MAEGAAELEQAPPATLAQALLAVQQEAVKISKDAEADIVGKDGKAKFKYKYLTLEKLLEEVLPVLSRNGLVWLSRPQVLNEGQPGLAYQILHAETGVSIDGAMPLMLRQGTPQDMGAAISYARRYALLTVLNIAPDEDKDGQISTAQAGAPKGKGVQRLTKAKAAELYERAVKAECLDKLQLAASHVRESKGDVGPMTSMVKGVENLQKLTASEGAKVADWISRKEAEALGADAS